MNQPLNSRKNADALLSLTEQQIRKIHGNLAELGVKDIGTGKEFGTIKEHFVKLDWHLHDLISDLVSFKGRVLTEKKVVCLWEDFKHPHQDMEHVRFHFTELHKSPIISEIEESLTTLESKLHKAIQNFAPVIKVVLHIIKASGRFIGQLENCYLQCRALKHGVRVNSPTIYPESQKISKVTSNQALSSR